MISAFRTQRHLILALAVFTAHGACTTRATAQVTPDQAAEMTLNSARKLFNEKKYQPAAARFREFLAKFGGHKDAPAARYGLALSLLESPERNYAEAQGLLQGLTAARIIPICRWFTIIWAWPLRGLGMLDLEIAQAKPNEAAQRRLQAQQRFQEALRAVRRSGQGFRKPS